MAQGLVGKGANLVLVHRYPFRLLHVRHQNSEAEGAEGVEQNAQEQKEELSGSLQFKNERGVNEGEQVADDAVAVPQAHRLDAALEVSDDTHLISDILVT